MSMYVGDRVIIEDDHGKKRIGLIVEAVAPRYEFWAEWSNLCSRYDLDQRDRNVRIAVTSAATGGQFGSVKGLRDMDLRFIAKMLRKA